MTALQTATETSYRGLSMTQPRGFSIRIFLPDGSVDGVRILEKSNWTGRAVVCPRTLFAKAKSRPEFLKTGVYVLTGPPSKTELPLVYIGEGDPVRPRLEQHAAKKDFWTSLVFFASKDENLNKAHVKYLEARLLQLAREAKRCDLDNANQPDLPSLSEADTAEIEGFLDEMLLCFPILGLSIFEKPTRVAHHEQLLHLRAKGIEARGYESPEGFVVIAGSQAVATEVPSIHGYLSHLRMTLLQHDLLRKKGRSFSLTQDYTFNSPSTAAGVLLGRSANGRTEWRDDHGKSLRQLQAG